MSQGVLRLQRLDRQRNRAILKDSRVNITSFVEGQQPASDHSETPGRSGKRPSSYGKFPPKEQDLLILCADGTIAALPAEAFSQPSAQLTQACSLFLCRYPSPSTSEWYFVLKRAMTSRNLGFSRMSSVDCLTVIGLARDLGRMTVAEDERRPGPQPAIVIDGFSFDHKELRRVILPCPEDFIGVIHMLRNEHQIAFSGLADQHAPYFYLTNSLPEERTIPADGSKYDEPIVDFKRPAASIRDLYSRFLRISRTANRRHFVSPEVHSAIARNEPRFPPRDPTNFHMIMPNDSALKEIVCRKGEFLFEPRELIEIAKVRSNSA